MVSNQKLCCRRVSTQQCGFFTLGKTHVKNCMHHTFSTKFLLFVVSSDSTPFTLPKFHGYQFILVEKSIMVSNLKVLCTCWLALQSPVGVCPLPPPQLASMPVKVGPIYQINNRAIIKPIILQNLRFRMLRVFYQGLIGVGNGIKSQFSRGGGLIFHIEIEILCP